jgi:hypothetical protein
MERVFSAIAASTTAGDDTAMLADGEDVQADLVGHLRLLDQLPDPLPGRRRAASVRVRGQLAEVVDA